jgi:uncharacterized protein YbjT (DUF2867 family)
MDILLTAANGRTGRKILKALARRGAAVRVFIRDDAQWPELEQLGAADYSVGDLEHEASLSAALRDCEQVLHIGPPMHPRELEITQAIMSAAGEHGTRRIIYYSVLHPMLRDIRHHRLKLDVEQALADSEHTYSVLQPGRYMQHLETQWARLLDTGVHSMPFSVKQGFSVVDLQDLAEATATVALEPGHDFARYELAGPELLSQEDMAVILSRVLGRPIRAEAQALDAMAEAARAKGASEDRVQQMLAMNEHYDRHGFRGNPNVLHWLLGRAPTSYEAYVRRLVEERGVGAA